jgi:membrane protein required for colicin V production
VNTTDWIIVAILGLSVLVGLFRGLIAELLSLATWIAAFWVASVYGPAVAALFDHVISLPMARIGVGYVLCFVVVLILGALLRFAVRRLLSSTGLSGIDRLFGMVFGFVRGVLLVSLLVFLFNLTGVTREDWWRQSVLLPQFQGVVAWLGQNMPASVTDHLRHPGTMLDGAHPEKMLDKIHASDMLKHVPSLLPSPSAPTSAQPQAAASTAPAAAASSIANPSKTH